jgi:hypothetical protein
MVAWLSSQEASWHAFWRFNIHLKSRDDEPGELREQPGGGLQGCRLELPGVFWSRS